MAGQVILNHHNDCQAPEHVQSGVSGQLRYCGFYSRPMTLGISTISNVLGRLPPDLA
jgi:hypothetical protein